MNIERRYLPSTQLETRSDEADQNTLVGYGAVFYQDGQPETEFELYPGYIERFAPGAFDESLKADDILCLFNHERSMVLGRNKAATLQLSVDTKGLFYRCSLPDTSCGRDVRVSLERRDISGSSVGFVAEQVTWTEQEDGPTIRLIERAKLFDVSPVTYAAYRGTEASLRSAALAEDLIREIESRSHLTKTKHRQALLRQCKIAELRGKMQRWETVRR
jgi:HK97 family phage prohead protease